MDSPLIKLSLEQEFSIQSFKTQVERMSPEQAKSFLIQLHTHFIIREATYKQLLKHKWGIEYNEVAEESIETGTAEEYGI